MTDRLTNPKNFPDAYKKKLEANQKQQPRLSNSNLRKSVDKSTDDIFERLYEKSTKSLAIRRSMGNLSYQGYPNGFKPLDENIKDKLRKDAIENQLKNGLSFYGSATLVPKSASQSQTIAQLEEKTPSRMLGIVDDMPPPKPLE